MAVAWVTTSSTNVEAIVNSIAAACERGFVPTDIYAIENPGVEDQVDRAIELASTIVTTYGEAKPNIHLSSLSHETEFDSIRTHVKEAIETTHNEGGDVAVDITPGRKFMSAIAFAAGIKYGADHVFYFYHESSKYYGRVYPAMPRTASRLVDFREAL